MTKWSPWRSVFAGAVIGFIEAAGSEEERRMLRPPDPVVRFTDRANLPAPPGGLWFITPLRTLSRYLNRN